MRNAAVGLTTAASVVFGLLMCGGALGQDGAPPPSPAGQPANLCQELLAFVKQPEPAKQAATPPPQQATAVSNASNQSQGVPSSKGDEVQKKAGLSGPVDGKVTEDKGANDPRTRANADAKDPAAAAKPAPSPRPDADMVAKVEASAAANDQSACRGAARAMRIAGVVLPAPLLALAALDPRYHPQ
ncbi:hypothetical protein [Methylobacterium gnaphalii]|uniref:Uncharacterized protein n=1 Tax=Methylobacterium gnaphalii TaxID=1010610 RepID=A0A512JQG2_9HYPH|nr:hypothetical protein [Methylobacterium gnaphalii]GEP12171.1 hypothetical protein MGN01_40160 [Methylobacterium gnaphalii]GJD67489.1 hypothetical protein MMMDOFMJ_0404 [Methylobacterium gnaphalii]GLS51293.1 hypothetical protein GCM10007885_41480 [Methylobacterium gnaphalii]